MLIAIATASPAAPHRSTVRRTGAAGHEPSGGDQVGPPHPPVVVDVHTRNVQVRKRAYGRIDVASCIDVGGNSVERSACGAGPQGPRARTRNARRRRTAGRGVSGIRRRDIRVGTRSRAEGGSGRPRRIEGLPRGRAARERPSRWVAHRLVACRRSRSRISAEARSPWRRPDRPDIRASRRPPDISTQPWARSISSRSNLVCWGSAMAGSSAMGSTRRSHSVEMNPS